MSTNSYEARYYGYSASTPHSFHLDDDDSVNSPSYSSHSFHLDDDSINSPSYYASTLHGLHVTESLGLFPHITSYFYGNSDLARHRRFLHLQQGLSRGSPSSLLFSDKVVSPLANTMVVTGAQYDPSSVEDLVDRKLVSMEDKEISKETCYFGRIPSRRIVVDNLERVIDRELVPKFMEDLVIVDNPSDDWELIQP